MVELAKPLERRDQNAVKGRDAAAEKWVDGRYHDCDAWTSYAIEFVRKASHTAFLAGVAAEREAWQAQHKKDQQNLVNCVEDLEEVQAALAKAEAALDKAEARVKELEARGKK